MMQQRRNLYLEAANAALAVRRQAHIGLSEPICVYDLAESLGIDVRFFDAASMEGLYCKARIPLIIVSSLRPRSRQVFTCAHELGHHIFKHGTRVDEIIADERRGDLFDKREFLADSFAGFLLMPKSTVSHAFVARNWDPANCTPIQVFTIAGWLGVGYATLIYHMSNTLRIMPRELASHLLKLSPKQIRNQIVDHPVDSNIILVDEHWEGRAIDVAEKDLIYLPQDTKSTSNCVRLLEQTPKHTIFEATDPGIGRFEHTDSNWSAYVRVSRRDFVGRAVYRHLEEVEDGNE